MQDTYPCRVILHGRLATLKGYRWIDGEKRAEVWQGSSRYFITLDKIKYA